MYQVVPLLLALALLIAWTGPADPGNRMAAANAADGLAEQALIYHQAAVAYVLANPGVSGVLTGLALPPVWSASGITACARGQVVATYVTVPSTVSKPAVAAAMARLWGGYPLVGQTAASTLTNSFTGVSLALPCPVPDQTPAIVSQAGG
jgi:hypothetical protein